MAEGGASEMAAAKTAEGGANATAAAETAGGGGSAVAAAIMLAPGEWQCPRCTVITSNKKKCGVCGQWRPKVPAA